MIIQASKCKTKGVQSEGSHIPMRAGSIYQTEDGEFFSDVLFKDCNPDPPRINWETEPVHVLYGDDPRMDWTTRRTFDGGNPKRLYKYASDPLPDVPWD